MHVGQGTSAEVDSELFGGGGGGGGEAAGDEVERRAEVGLEEGTAEFDASRDTPHIWHLTILSVAPGGGGGFANPQRGHGQPAEVDDGVGEWMTVGGVELPRGEGDEVEADAESGGGVGCGDAR